MTTPAAPPAPPHRERRTSSSAARTSARAQSLSRFLPARPVIGFLALLALLFALSYAAGTVVGPVAPGLHPADRPRTGTTEPTGDGGMGGMPGMGSMGAPTLGPVSAGDVR
ncbi:hypothetical protein GCM10010211_27940 [Streptomyces albospinus]|uniref:Uncharacterized protein n=1 Tax=Streptomyces albospinus TaxID=285515 RepID=A0ABQ2UZA2_9ACTN|nr:hypothetical protein [Streptomyces albospinus]GGU61383.1 hypothetical protein GCM10010211_27940 [Streptomyces albospinus]